MMTETCARYSIGNSFMFFVYYLYYFVGPLSGNGGISTFCAYSCYSIRIRYSRFFVRTVAMSTAFFANIFPFFLVPPSQALALILCDWCHSVAVVCVFFPQFFSASMPGYILTGEQTFFETMRQILSKQKKEHTFERKNRTQQNPSEYCLSMGGFSLSLEIVIQSEKMAAMEFCVREKTTQ